jgi:SOS-response transcriptional repressor LexA
LAEYLCGRLKAEHGVVVSDAVSADPALTRQQPLNVVPFIRVSAAQRAAGYSAVPLVDLRFTAGAFSGYQALHDAAFDWVEPPDWLRPQPQHFIAQVMGASMNRRIPDGAWCLFKARPESTRQGKVVVVQHRDGADPHTGGRFTVKVYSSEKIPSDDGGWRHSRVTLAPDSDVPGFEPIVLDADGPSDAFTVVAELVAVLEP